MNAAISEMRANRALLLSRRGVRRELPAQAKETARVGLEQVDQARAVLKQTRDDLSKTTIYAPMAGTISELNKEVGEIAVPGQSDDLAREFFGGVHPPDAEG